MSVRPPGDCAGAGAGGAALAVDVSDAAGPLAAAAAVSVCDFASASRTLASSDWICDVLSARSARRREMNERRSACADARAVVDPLRGSHGCGDPRVARRELQAKRDQPPLRVSRRAHVLTALIGDALQVVERRHRFVERLRAEYDCDRIGIAGLVQHA